MVTTASPDASLRPIQPSPAEWDAFVLAQPGAHLLQLSGWGRLKARFGWESRIVALAGDGEIQAGALVLLKRLPLALGTMAYAPMGGYASSPGMLKPLWAQIRRETRAAFLKLEPGHVAGEALRLLQEAGFRPSPQTIQPPRTIVLDIDADDATILKRMSQGTRRKVRKSLKSGLHFEIAGRGDLNAFQRLARQTGERNDFGVHSASYFENVYDIFMPERGALWLARLDGELLAAVMVFAAGERAWYLYGASSRARGNVYASYGIQWQAIQWARARGCRCYDFWGVPDYDPATLEAQFKGRGDGLWGVYGFKRGWGGQVLRTAGAWDKPFNPLVYAAYRGALRIRQARKGGEHPQSA